MDLGLVAGGREAGEGGGCRRARRWVGGWVSEWALRVAGEVRRTYLQRGLLRAVNVHIPSF